jgi:hypothetical protein
LLVWPGAPRMATSVIAAPPPKGGDRRGWDALRVLRNWRESPVLQRVRLLAEAEAVLVIVPMAVGATLPHTRRVLPRLKAPAAGSVDLTAWASPIRSGSTGSTPASPT